MTAAKSSPPAGIPAVKSAVRTVELLDYLCNQGDRPQSLAEIQQALAYPKSSLYALLRTLVGMGWLETDQTGTLYRIGMRALMVGAAYVEGDPVVVAARETLDWLAAETGETIHFARLDGTDVVYLSTRASQHYVRPASRVGRRMPAFATSLGKALLATRPDHELGLYLPEKLEPITSHTITDEAVLREELQTARTRGWAVDIEENTEGLRCVGVALRIGFPARDAVSCSVPNQRMTKAKEKVLGSLLLQARDRIEAEFRGYGYTPQ